MPPFPDIPIHHYRRLASYDYTKGAALFISISTEPRRQRFGIVRNAKVELSKLGKLVLESMESIPEHNPGIVLYEHVVMPDHVHMNLRIQPGLPEPLKVLGQAINGFKGYTTKRFHALGGTGTLWQQGYHDYLCPGRPKIEATARYIKGNPLKWEMMYNAANPPQSRLLIDTCDRGAREGRIARPMAEHQDTAGEIHCANGATLRVREPLGSPYLDPAEYWRGVGEIGLLDAGNRIVSARISRSITKAELNAALARLSRAVDQGFIIISHFASPGEHELRDMLVARVEARFIVASESQIPYGFKPDSRFLEPIWQHRCLIIGKGNEEGEFTRPACLDVNAEIKRIALASGGFATYWKQGGVEIER